MTGSNLFTLMPQQSPNHYSCLVDDLGFVVLGKFDTAATPDTTANIFQAGCLMFKTDSSSGSAIFQNVGTLAAPTWELLGVGAGFSLPIVVTDSTTTTGSSFEIVESTLTTGKILNIVAPALTTGTGIEITASLMTNGLMELLNAPAITDGGIYVANSGPASMTANGAYFLALTNHGLVFQVGVNGHIVTGQFVAPTISIGVGNGITGALITAGSTDTAGNITTTGTNDNVGNTSLHIVFNAPYAIAPKAVMIEATDAGGAVSQTFVVPSTTGFTLGIIASATAQANPSFSYLVIA